MGKAAGGMREQVQAESGIGVKPLNANARQLIGIMGHLVGTQAASQRSMFVVLRWSTAANRTAGSLHLGLLNADMACRFGHCSPPDLPCTQDVDSIALNKMKGLKRERRETAAEAAAAKKQRKAAGGAVAGTGE